jgi:hypothetical protein
LKIKITGTLNCFLAVYGGMPEGNQTTGLAAFKLHANVFSLQGNVQLMNYFK